MTAVRTKVSRGGRVVIPAEFRRSLGLSEGDEVIMFLQDGEIRMVTPERAIELAQKLVRQYVPEGVSLVDQLIAERRREAELE